MNSETLLMKYESFLKLFGQFVSLYQIKADDKFMLILRDFLDMLFLEKHK